ncbi:MAG TPA: IS1380 family transposase, partial [Desulfobacterales bacterium]|nr:IS1380 family transposase [Desulfobacterales bacterium]
MYEKTRGKTVLFHSFYYQAGSWEHPRRAVVRAEVSQRGKNVRFTVSNAEHAK